jgi:serine/threonine protein kinase
MSETDGVLPADSDEPFCLLVEKFESALHEGRDETPEDFLRNECSGLLQQMEHIRWCYRMNRPEAPAEPASPVAIPGFLVQEELGRGGMGVVYKAIQVGLNRQVALKVLLHGAHAGAEQRARFRTEALALARLTHEHIVPIHEVGEHEGRPYLVLPWMDGGSLKEWINNTPRAARPSALLVETLARAVHYAHQKGVVHRDLKPANILLDAADQPHVTDFGLAKQLDDEANPTRTGAVVGTPSYMAPEQARGQIREVGPAADVYALGAILYELLTGGPPFRAEADEETRWQVLHQDPDPITRKHRKVPRDLETICLKCLHKSPPRRYASAVELAEDLRRFADGRPIRARPVGLWERGRKWVRRNWLWAALIGAGLCALGLLVALLVSGWQSNQALQEAADREHAKAEEAAKQQKLAADHLQGALDFLEPMSMEVRAFEWAKIPGGVFFRNQFASRARAFYQKLLADKDNPDRSVRRQIGRAFHGLGMSHAVLNEYSAAEKSFRQAVERQEQLVEEFPADESYRVDLALTYQNRGDNYAAQDDKVRAGAAYARILPLFQTLPPNIKRIALFAQPLSKKLFDLGKYREALVWHNRVIDYLQSSLQGETRAEQRQQLAFTLAMTYNLRGLLFLQLDNPAQAIQEFDRVRQVHEARLPWYVILQVMQQRVVAVNELAKQKKSRAP